MTKSRPFGITLLAILAGLAAVVAVIHTLQMLHLFPVFLGPVAFFTFDLLGAIMWGIMALIWIWVVRMLWNVDPQGWLFVVILASLNLILAVVSILGASSWQELLPSIVFNGAALIYCLLPGTKAAFGTA
jgi:hypothetical protein